MQTSISWFLFFLMSSPGLSLEREGQQESLSIGYDGTMHGTSSNRSSLMRKADLAAGRNGKEQIQSGTPTSWTRLGTGQCRDEDGNSPKHEGFPSVTSNHECQMTATETTGATAYEWRDASSGYSPLCQVFHPSGNEGISTHVTQANGDHGHTCYVKASTPENGECPPGRKYRLIITTGTEHHNDGTLNVKVDEGNGYVEKVWGSTSHPKGSEVLDACFSELVNVGVANPTNNAWAGTIEIKKNGAEVVTQCIGCQGAYTTGSKVVIDGNGDGEELALVRCLNDKGYTCHFRPKTYPEEEVAGTSVIAIR